MPLHTARGSHGARDVVDDRHPVEMDLVTRWMLWFFAALLASGLGGVLVARLATFELGMGVGLLVPGIVSLAFTGRFLAEYRALAYDPARTTGAVVAVEDRPANASGSITSPVAVVEYAPRDGVRTRIDGPRSSSLRVGDEVVVVPRAGAPSRPRVGRPRDMRGGAIAALLFGTFPFAAGVFFLVSAFARVRSAAEEARRVAAEERSYVTTAANLLMLSGILATPFFADPVEHAVMLGFGVVSLGLWAHVVQGIRMRRDPRWTVGVGVVAVSFSSWVVALWFLTDPNAGW